MACASLALPVSGAAMEMRVPFAYRLALPATIGLCFGIMLMDPSLVAPASRLLCAPLGWIWPGRLAHGKLSIFDGDPGIGKSLVTLDLCARMTVGRPFPDGSPALPPASVIILNAEDAGANTVVPRLRALGADLDRAFLFSNDFLDQSGSFRLPEHTQVLERALRDTGAVFVVLDPIMAFLDATIQATSDMSVRRALAPLAQIAERYGCHISMIRHLNKSGDSYSLYRGGGSIGFLAACRAGFLFARDPQDPLRAVMAQTKNNLGPLQPSLAYRLQDQPSGPPLVEWLGAVSLGADVLLSAAGRKPTFPTPRDRAEDFLAAFLDAAPRSTLDIWAAAREQGHSRMTLYRTHARLKIRTRTLWTQDRLLTYWLLPGQALPFDITPPDPDIPSLEPWLAPLREPYPGDPLEVDE